MMPPVEGTCNSFAVQYAFVKVKYQYQCLLLDDVHIMSVSVYALRELMACACLVTGEVVESYTWPCFPFLLLSSEMQDVHIDVEMFPLMTKSHFEGKLSVLVAAMFLC